MSRHEPEPGLPFPSPAREPGASAALPAALRAAQAQIVADLQTTQGAWQQRSLAARFGFLVAALAVALVPWLAIKLASSSVSAMVLALGGALAFLAVGVATSRPGLASRLAAGGGVAALVAVGIEATRAVESAVVQPVLKCASLEVAFLVPVAILLAVHVRRSRLPARAGHVLAIASAGLCGSAVVWLSCMDTRLEHLVLEHSGATALAVAAATLGVGIALRRTAGR